LHRNGPDLGDHPQANARSIAIHLEGMKEDGLPIPKPTIIAEQVQVDAA
jgi:predicted RNase H-like HicB family nuclease